jgi:CheY-like chemotaxis protein
MSDEQKVGYRPVRIHLAIKDGPLPRAIKQVLPILGNESSHVYVENMDEADLVIFTEMRDVERGYNKEKSYAYLQIPGTERSPRLSENCQKIDALNIMAGLLNAITEARKGLKPLETPVAEVVEEVIPLRPDALSILVIDDTPKHIVSAKSGLAGHKLTVATGYEEAMEILGKEKFDVVLTDLQMPMSSRTLGPDAFKLGQLVPYGIMLMIEASHKGVKHVAVVTDLNHHADWLSAAFDRFRYPINIDGAKVLMMHAPMKDDAKDWAQALKILMKD